MKNSNKIARKSEKNQDGDQHCWVVISGSKGDVQKGKFGCFKEMGSNLMKSKEKEDKDDFTYQRPSNRSLGGWSHDQLPKMVKKQKL